MKNYQLAVGIDVSKKTLDVFIHNHSKHRVFDNTRSGYLSLEKWVGKFSENEKPILYCLFTIWKLFGKMEGKFE